MTDTMQERESAEKLLGDAMNLMRRAYYQDVREYAEGIVDEIKAGDIADRDALSDRIHETADGSQWVIYTFKARCVVMASDNDGAYADEFGDEGIVKDGDINWSGLAYAALGADLCEALEAEGVDLNGDTKAEMLGEDDTNDDETV